MEVLTMGTQGNIRRHLLRMNEQIIFTTREFLIYGTRSAVDQALYRMVNDGYLCRLSRGVFTRPKHLSKKISVLDVAYAKAQAFGKRLAVWGADIAAEVGFLPKQTSEQTLPAVFTFYTDGPSSSFRFGQIIIRLLRVTPKKMRISNSRGGKIIRAIWYLGPRVLNAEQIREAISKCYRTEREELRLSSAWLPDWLNRYFRHIQLPKATYYEYPHPYAVLPG